MPVLEISAVANDITSLFVSDLIAFLFEIGKPGLFEKALVKKGGEAMSFLNCVVVVVVGSFRLVSLPQRFPSVPFFLRIGSHPRL